MATPPPGFDSLFITIRKCNGMQGSARERSQVSVIKHISGSEDVSKSQISTMCFGMDLALR